MQIATASEEQSHVAEDVNRNISHIADMARECSEEAGEIQQGIEDVSAKSKQLNELIARYQVSKR